MRLIEGDVLDMDFLNKAVEGSNIIIHLAAIAGVDTVLKNRVRTMRINLIGTYNILETAMTQGDNLERLILFSTSEVFGTHAYKVEETHLTSQGSVGEARWTYAVSKLAGEHLAHSYFDEYRLPVVIVRPFNIYGPRQVGEGAIHHFIVRALKGEDLIINGDGSQIRAWCYIDDMVEGVLLCLRREEAVGNVFNIGNPRSTLTIYDLAERIIRLAQVSSKIVFRPLTYVDIDIRIPNIDKARNILYYEPKINLDEGIRKTLEWYRG